MIITAALIPAQIHVQVCIRFIDATNHRSFAPTDPWILRSTCVVGIETSTYGPQILQVSMTLIFSRCAKHSICDRNVNLISFKWGKFISRHEEFIYQNQLKFPEFLYGIDASKVHWRLPHNVFRG